jgi:hypothetical protein
MQAKIIVFPREDGFNVMVWGKWTEGSMRVRRFDDRASMVVLLEDLRLITPQEAQELEHIGFTDSCPLYSAEIEEDSLAAHGFHTASPSNL